MTNHYHYNKRVEFSSWSFGTFTFAYMMILSLVLIIGCGNRLGQDDKISDKNEEIVAKVKLALVQESGLDAAPIDVKVREGIVILDGFVEDESQRMQAAKAAGRVPGVHSVTNDIQIK